VIASRKRFLENDDECYYLLGSVLHYIQDSWTLNPRVKDKHTAWEKYIHKSTSEIMECSKLEGSQETKSAKASLCLRELIDRFHDYIQDAVIPTTSIDQYYSLCYMHTFPITITLHSLYNDKTRFDRTKKNWSDDLNENLVTYKAIQFPYVTDIKNVGHWIQKEGYHGVLGGTLAFALMGRPYTSFTKYSLPFIDLFFALFFSLGVSCQILFPVQLSPEMWKNPIWISKNVRVNIC
jgi:hypothetical protein